MNINTIGKWAVLALVVIPLGYFLWQYGGIYLWGNDYDSMLADMYSGEVGTLRPDEVVARTDSFIFLDTRSVEEFEVSHLEGARLLEYREYKPEMVMDLDKARPVLVYCSVGYRSDQIGQSLQKLGFEKVYNLYGGIFQWVNEGYPVFNRHGQPTDSVHGFSWLWQRWLNQGTVVY